VKSPERSPLPTVSNIGGIIGLSCEGIICSDDDPCTIEVCLNGQCNHQPLSCDDLDICTQDECINGVCIHTSLNCGNSKCSDDSVLWLLLLIKTVDNLQATVVRSEAATNVHRPHQGALGCSAASKTTNLGSYKVSTDEHTLKNTVKSQRCQMSPRRSSIIRLQHMRSIPIRLSQSWSD